MSVDPNELFALPAAEQLRLVELIWDNLGESNSPIPLPDWIEKEAVRRRDELIANQKIGLDHQTVWERIDRRND